MSKPLSTAEKGRLERVIRNKKIVDALRSGSNSDEVSSGSFTYRVVGDDSGFGQLVRKNKKTGKERNLGITFGLVERSKSE